VSSTLSYVAVGAMTSGVATGGSMRAIEMS